MKHLVLILCLLSTNIMLTAQGTRYIDEVFTSVSVQKNIVYGSNYTILPIILQTATQPQIEDLEMDIYSPVGDTLTDRPLVIVAHRGDYLPRVINQSPYGTREDSAVVELCRELAKRGYVAASISYRLGWNPFGEDITRKKGVLEATYRVTQDMRTCVRFFRKNAAEDGNTYRIDPERIAVGAFDAAAYAAYNVAYLRRFDQIELPKFVDFSQQPPEVFIDTTLYGNPYGTQERTLNVANYPEYSSDVSMVFGFQGGLGDFSWIEAGDLPAIGVIDASALELTGIRDVTISATGDIIIADGARPDTVIHQSQALGNNNVWIDQFDDPLTQLALQRSGGIEGLLLLKPEVREGEVLCDSTAGAQPSSYRGNIYPWNWYDEQLFSTLWNFIPDQTVPGDVQVCRENLGNPNDPELSRSYVDTLARYIAPRIITAMNANTSISRSGQIRTHHFVKIYPVPAEQSVSILSDKAIQVYEITDIAGKHWSKKMGINRQEITVQQEGMPAGFYLLRLYFDDGFQTHKLIWK